MLFFVSTYGHCVCLVDCDSFFITPSAFYKIGPITFLSAVPCFGFRLRCNRVSYDYYQFFREDRTSRREREGHHVGYGSVDELGHHHGSRLRTMSLSFIISVAITVPFISAIPTLGVALDKLGVPEDG